MSARWLEGGWPLVWIGLAVAALYLKAVTFGYTYLDDHVLLLENRHFLGNPANFLELFTGKEVAAIGVNYSYYRPLLMASLMLDAQVGGADTAFYHLTNIAYHAAACGLLFLLLVRLGHRRALAFFFSLLFAVHPALTQSVVWISGRTDTLPTFFILASTLFFLRFLEKGGWRALGGHLLFFGAALFVKENMLMLPALLVIYLFFVERELSHLKALAPGWGVVVAGYLFLRQVALAGTHSVTLHQAARSVAEGLPALIQYLGKGLFPVNLSVLPTLRDTSFVWGMLALGLVTPALFFSRKGRPGMALFGGCWFLFFLVPCFVRPEAGTPPFFLEHRITPALVGLWILLLELDWVQRLDFRRMGTRAGALAVLAGFAGTAFVYSERYRDRLSFWESAVESSPHSPLAHRNLGAMHYLDGRLEAAEREFRHALALNPQEAMAHNNLGLIYVRRGLDDQAEKAFLRELSLYPDYDDAHCNLGFLYHRLGRHEEAVRHWERTVAINPHYEAAYRALVAHYLSRGEEERAAFYAGKGRQMGLLESRGGGGG